MQLYPTTYTFNVGTWFVYDPATNRGGDGATHPNADFRTSAIADGLSQPFGAPRFMLGRPILGTQDRQRPTFLIQAAEVAVIADSGIKDRIFPTVQGRVEQSGRTRILITVPLRLPWLPTPECPTPTTCALQYRL